MSACKRGEGSHKERGQRAKSCQVQCQLERRKKLIMLVTGRRASEKSSRVDSDVSISKGQFFLNDSKNEKKTRAWREI